MSEFLGVGINILSSGIAFILGLSLRTIIHRYQIHRSRGFWGRGIGKGKTVIFLGSFPSEMFANPVRKNEAFEPTGMVGLGDTRAVHELTSLLSNLGVAAEMAYANAHNATGLTKGNVILLGAEESNSLVKGPFHSVPTTLKFETSSPLTLHDELRNESYQAVWEDAEIVVDYGKLLRVRNPYAPECTLTMICGIYGYGTWGGVRLLADQQFLKRCAELDDAFELECIYKVLVHQGEPEFVIPLDVRQLREASPVN
jgi:hypothetical protein